MAMLSLPSIRIDRVQLELAAQDGIGLHRRESQGLMIYKVISKQQPKPLHFVVQRHTADPQFGGCVLPRIVVAPQRFFDYPPLDNVHFLPQRLCGTGQGHDIRM